MFHIMVLELYGEKSKKYVDYNRKKRGLNCEL